MWASESVWGEHRRRTAGVLVLAALFSLPALEYARAELTSGVATPGAVGAVDAAGAAGAAGPVRLLEPTPWQAFRAGASLDVVAAADTPACTVVWHDGTVETVLARRGTCTTSRVVDRPGVYAVSVTAPGTATGSPVPVVAYDPHAGPARGSGVTDGIRYSIEAGYVPWRRSPAAAGAGAFDGPGGLSARVAGVDWVLVTPGRTTAVRGTAVATDGTATMYAFVLYGEDGEGLRLTQWHRVAR